MIRNIDNISVSFTWGHELTLAQLQEVLRIWNSEYPSTLVYSSEQFDEYLLKLEDKHVLLATDSLTGKVYAWYQDFIRDEDRWFALLIHRSVQGMGLGRIIMEEAMSKNKVLNGWVVDRADCVKADGTPYLSPLKFYQKLGFTVLPDSRLQTERMNAVQIRFEQA